MLIEIKHEWEAIGIALDVKSSLLGELRISNVDSKARLIRVIENWYDDTMPTAITWKTILDAVEGSIVDNRAMGLKIREYLGVPSK